MPSPALIYKVPECLGNIGERTNSTGVVASPSARSASSFVMISIK
jgi:hypothetical protein